MTSGTWDIWNSLTTDIVLGITWAKSDRMAVLSTFVKLAFAVSAVSACSSCEGEEEPSVYPRVMRRMQPEAENATGQPRAPLHWGEINFLHTSDSHGWLEGHVKERNYGADWGDFVSFTKHMKDKADEKKVDLVLIDTGTLNLTCTHCQCVGHVEC